MTDIEPAGMSGEEIAAFLASLARLRDGLDDFNCQLASIDGAGMRLGVLCQETAAACPVAASEIAWGLAGVARSLSAFGAVTGEVLPTFLAVAEGLARGMRLLEIKRRKGMN